MVNRLTFYKIYIFVYLTYDHFSAVYCLEDPEIGSCRNFTNKWFYNRNNSRCDVFTWSCGDHGNKFPTNAECLQTCTGITLRSRLSAVGNRNTNAYNNYNNNDNIQDRTNKMRIRNGVYQY